MKTILVTLCVLLICNTGFSQNKRSIHPPRQKHDLIGGKQAPITRSKEKPVTKTYYKDGRELTFIPIGQSANAYGFSGNPRTYLWVDNNTNSVVFTHRMINDSTNSSSSHIAYDLSTNGGAAGSWTNNIKVYNPTPIGPLYFPARYPQGGIYNPPGNTNPENAYYTYFAPVLLGGNGDWGRYGYGVNKLTEVDPPNPTQHNELTSGGDIWRYILNAFTITQDGYAWMVEPSYNVADSLYTGDLIIEKGTFNPDSNDYEYEEWLMPALEAGDNIIDTKIAFSPDGQTGYIMLLSDTQSDPIPYTWYHPVLYKTEDGGNTWEGPIHCQLGGPDGLEEVKEFVPDWILPWPTPDRDSIYYSMGYHVDMVVDAWGGAHITGLIAISNDEGQWFTSYEAMGTFHLIYSSYWGTEWETYHLYYNRTFDGDLGGLTQYNRPQISSDPDGHFFAISWIDTDQEGVTENVSPDIYCVTFYILPWDHSEVFNITSFTQAMWSAYLGSQSHYMFKEVFGDGWVEYTIPFVYQGLDPADPFWETQFWYIDGFKFEWPIGTPEIPDKKIPSVSQNHPNPFSNTTSIRVDLKECSGLSLEIINLAGQKIARIDKGFVNTGTHEFILNACDFHSGIYFYTVNVDEMRITKKMVVE